MVSLKNVRVHNLKSVSIDLPQGKLICFTGVSGSGKSSLAFDTIYVEGQRRYVEALETGARRFLGQLSKPDLDAVDNITPTISIEQKTAGRNPRSTVGTMTEIYDYMRVLWARLGTAYCPISGEAVGARSREEIIDEVTQFPAGTRMSLLAPFIRSKKGTLKDEINEIERRGFGRIRIDGVIQQIGDSLNLEKSHAHDLDIVIDRIESSPTSKTRIIESVGMALDTGSGSLIVALENGEERLYSTRGYSPKSGLSYEPLDPQDFSFNSPSGMCPHCQGMGQKHEYVLERIIDPDKSISEDCCSIASPANTVRYSNIYRNLAEKHHFSLRTPWKELSPEAKQLFLYGTDKKWSRMQFIHPETGARWFDLVQWKGVLDEAYEKYQKAKSDNYKARQESLMRLDICPACHGARIKPFAAAAEFHGKKIWQVAEMPISEVIDFFASITLTHAQAEIGKELIREIRSRLHFLHDVGLEYLSLSRSAPTLSGGESQRVRLASQIGSGLVGITYILDEPSIGLHPHDNKKLIRSLQHLRDQNNTVIVVEHDEETIRSADHIVDFGPKAGLEGGEILYSGSLPGLLRHKTSLTGKFLSGRLEIAIPKARKKPSGKYVELHGAVHHNLKNVTAKIPLGCFVAVTGVSGSGKSSLFPETLYPAMENRLEKTTLPTGAYESLDLADIDKVIEIDQSPIGRTPRSNPATYIGLFNLIRDLYAKLPQSIAKGYKPGRFSFNVHEGSCPECSGLGAVKIDMDFLEESWIPCPECNGARFDEETLLIRYKEKNIRDVLEMDVLQALDHFANIPPIKKRLETLLQVGLDYLKLGQSSTTLSGGEAQRIKLAKELVRPATGKTLYILDEPTTGLHFYDLGHLLDVLHTLCDRGNTVVVIEHNMDLVKTADWIIDMGPGSGVDGGHIIAEGPPEEIAKQDSATGRVLAEIFSPSKMRDEPKAAPQKFSGDIVVQGARQNNLKGGAVTFPRGRLSVITGPSGAGKSSLAFDTIFAEGQRRYTESLSPYIRQFVKQCPRPRVDKIEGLSPTIAIEQRTHSSNPRSTVGTMTEVYDYLRILYARIGIPHCPKTGFEIRSISKEHVVEKILALPPGEKLHILAPLDVRRLDTFRDTLERLRKEGFLRIRLNNIFYELGRSDIPFEPKRKNELFLVIDRVTADAANKMRLLEACETASTIGKGKIVVARAKSDLFFNLSFAVVETGETYPEITPHTFAFNTPAGMCPDCQGLGFLWGIDLSQIPELRHVYPTELLSEFWGFYYSDAINFFNSTLNDHLDENELLQGSKKWITVKKFGSPFRVRWKGINQAIAESIKHNRAEETALPENFRAALQEHPCPACGGARISALARHVTIEKVTLPELVRMPLDRAKAFIDSLKIDFQGDLGLKYVYDELKGRLGFLNTIGLGYLSLERAAPTLSGGEASRVRLARGLGSGLSGVLYVLDEPTCGLHPQDSIVLLAALEKLTARGNTIIAVEHDPQFIQSADWLVEMGPGAGKFGGEIVSTGPAKKYHEPKPALAKRPPLKKKKAPTYLEVKDASINNLKSISCAIPLEKFTAITGVSGSGKSTLLFDVLAKEWNKLKGGQKLSGLVVIDQKPMGQTARSDVASYTDLLGPLRSFFAALPEARARGLEPKHFSSYHRKGMCSHCFGMGYKKVYMHFLPPIKVACPECRGLRLNPLSLSVRYNGKNLGEIFTMTCDEIYPLFQHHPKIRRTLDMLRSLGLSYLSLGQEMNTLSGGEAQRMKLAWQLLRRTTGPTLYLLDEPTVGLAPREVATIIDLLLGLREHGHTVITVEHNLDMIRASDHIIDLGPGAGDLGGEIVCQGTPAEIAKCPSSITAKFLRG
jgi:excinuclease ABC subunit A